MDVDDKKPDLRSEKIIRLVRNGSEKFWHGVARKRMIEVFQKTARTVPAYKDFLRKNKINPVKIKSFEDFKIVPPVSKKNYLLQYPFKDLAWGGKLNKPSIFTSTSSSTGEPFYFLRSHQLEWESSIAHELFMRLRPVSSEKPILIVVGFGMGVWIGGLITYRAFEIAAERGGHSVSIITPGINKIEILKSLKNLAPHYSQIILAGYPPFIKDVIDEAQAEKVNIKKLNLRLLFAAETFTENFRDYVAKKAGIKNIYLDTFNIYGSADIGTMAYETPISILVRRLAIKNHPLFNKIFPEVNKTPTFAQYNPLFINFESTNGELLLTGDNVIPLVRYDMGDHGGVMEYGDVLKKINNEGFSLAEETRRAGIENHIYKLPFVYVYERKDLSTTLYGLQIYPEMVRETLIINPLNRFLTGKASMITRFDKNHNQYLEINLELRKNQKPIPKLKAVVSSKIFKNLRLKNSEFRELHNYLGDKVIPRLVFWQYEHPLHFKPGIKQKWIKKA